MATIMSLSESPDAPNDRPDALELSARIRRGELSAQEALQQALARCDAVNPRVQAVNSDLRTYAQGRVDQINGSLAPFAGVPFLLKDLGMDLAGYPTSCKAQHGLRRNATWFATQSMLRK